MSHWPERCNQSLCDGHIAGIRRALDKDQENRGEATDSRNGSGGYSHMVSAIE